ncbi:MAG: vWA domain-containing protein [Bdellovibrionia bacterium]
MFVLSACNQLKFTPINQEGKFEVPSETPEVPEIPESNEEIVPISKVISVEPAQNNPYLDILLVLDDSASMKEDLLKLAARLANFTKMLEDSGMEWQMCLTTSQGYATTTGVEFGRAIPWKISGTTNRKVIARRQANLDNIFKTTINAIPIGLDTSWDERGIRSTVEHIQRNPDCYRAGASKAVILISDEDEASIGGIPSRLRSTDAPEVYKPLTDAELPLGSLATIRNRIGDVNFTFNSIVIKSGDFTCEDQQNIEAPAYSGDRYIEMSGLTDGGVGSICDSDYTKHLKLFRDKILNTLKTVELECKPHRNIIRIAVDGKPVTNYKVQDVTVTFDQAIPEGSTIELNYDCARQKPGKGDLNPGKGNGKSPVK